MLPPAIVAVSFLAAIFFYPAMPERMASHWDTAGNVNGYMPKFWGLLLMPLLSLVLYAVFLVLPRIDPLKGIRKFQNHYDMFVTAMLAFLLYIYAATLAWNLGYTFSMTYVIVPGLAALYYLVGMVLSHAKRNWFMGIRTPWTLSDEHVWRKTNTLGAKLFKACAVLALLGLAFKETLYFSIVPVILCSLGLVIYSYVLYSKRHK